MTKKRRVFFIIFWALTVFWASVIFNFSATEGNQSIEQSAGFVEMFFDFVSLNKAESTKNTENTENALVVNKSYKSQETQEASIQTTVGTQTNDASGEQKTQTQNKNSDVKPVQKESVQKRKPYVLNENTNVLREWEQKREDRVQKSIEQNKNMPMFTALNSVIRKMAHISSYVLLAFLTYFAVGYAADLTKRYSNIPWISVTLCVLFACTDEYHQSFVRGRSGKLSDVIVDSFGILIGTLVAFWIARGIVKNKNRKNLSD